MTWIERSPYSFRDFRSGRWLYQGKMKGLSFGIIWGVIGWLSLGSAPAQDEAERPVRPTGGLFSVLDKDRNGIVSQEEIDRAAHSLRALDVDGDGSLSSEELRLRPIPGGGQGGPPWDDLDRNQDGKIARSEIPERLNNLFNRMDRNGDGVLDREERDRAARFMRERRGGGAPPLGAGRDRGEIWDVLAGKHDHNKDGTITSEEYSRGEERFAALDRNGDGRLTPADLTDRTRRGGPGRARGEAPQAGDPAPDFELSYATKEGGPGKGAKAKLSAFAGKRPVALVFGSYT